MTGARDIVLWSVGLSAAGRTPEGWTAAASDGSSAALAVEHGAGGAALRIDWTLADAQGWVIARREIEAVLPEHYAVVLRVRGGGSPVQLQLKLVDPSGANVWWWRRAAFSPSADASTVVLRRASLEFAWGPASGGAPSRLGAVEVALAAAPGAGTLVVEDLRVEARDPASATPRIAAVSASSTGSGDAAALASRGGSWRAAAGDRAPWIELDLARTSEWGGVVMDFESAAPASRLLASADGAAWIELARDEGGGTRRWLRTSEGEGRFARVELAEPARVARVAIVPLELAVSPSRYVSARAARERRGLFPRHLLGEQAYWALVGADGDERKGLLSEDGALEVDAEGFTLEPFLRCGERLVSWADASASCSLEGGSLPIPSVAWAADDATLQVTAFASGEAGRSTLVARYRVAACADRPLRATLMIAVRPFQVNPAWQGLNIAGGVSPITSIAREGRCVRVNGSRTVVAVSEPDAFGAWPSGASPAPLEHGLVPACDRVDDPVGFAEGALAYRLDLAAGEAATIAVAVPWFDESPPPPRLPRAEAAAWADRELAACAERWRARLAVVPVELPDAAREFRDTLFASIAWVLVNREGPRIQPGPRCYRRSWIRDGALTGTALAEMGFADEARAFLRWYAPFQHDDGRVPCAVDRHGIDPVAEHDSHGQFVWGVVEVWRLTGDRAFLEEMWPRVAAAAGAIERLRAERTTAAYLGSDAYGLMPESISHEGYSSRPVHAYWDDFFAVRGLGDAADAAAELGHAGEAARLLSSRDAMRVDLHRSIAATMARHGLDVLPGSVELGDFDPTSSAIALDPCAEGQRLPQQALRRTFERYWEEFDDRRSGRRANDAYTAYEVRNTPALLLLGEKQRAVELLEWLIRDQRPPAWRQWPEVTTRDPRAPRFLGDLPHGWIASSFVRTLRRMIAFERADDGALVLGAGIPEAWVRDGQGVRVRGLATHAGPLDLAIRAEGDDRVVVTLGDRLRWPAAGVVVESPLARTLTRVVVDGTAVVPDDPHRIVLRAPAREVILGHGPLREDAEG